MPQQILSFQVRTRQQSELQKADHVLESKPGNSAAGDRLGSGQAALGDGTPAGRDQAQAVLELEARGRDGAIGAEEVG
jgi:hypothetical protein